MVTLDNGTTLGEVGLRLSNSFNSEIKHGVNFSRGAFGLNIEVILIINGPKCAHGLETG